MEGTLIFVLLVVILVVAAVFIIDRTLPGDAGMIAKIVVGVLGLIALIYRLAPLAGM